MTTFKTKLTTAIATGSVLLQAMAPVTFASSTIEISGNGAGSDNTASVTQTSTTTVNQNNTAIVDNNVEANADTGGNDANFNTGGDVTVDTGNATANATVSNNLNTNVANVEDCGQCSGDTDVLISGNGAFTDNAVNVRNTNTTTVNQNNYANVDNNVDLRADTGDNDAGFNTGDGDVTIRTGKATINADVSTHANRNVAQIGGNGGDSDVSLRILNNGAGSDNVISARLANTTVLNQNNTADIDNDVEANADTGDNDANFNTGDGDFVIDTGNATVNATVDNAVNFNAADVDCGCVYGLTAKIAGNGADIGENLRSDNENRISADLANVRVFGQNNYANLDNNLDRELEAETGNNEASMNTAGSYSDPSVRTGDAEINADVSNSGNHNVLGNVNLPQMDFDWDFSGLWSFFGMMMHS